MSLQMHGLTIRAALISSDSLSAQHLSIQHARPIRHGCDISDRPHASSALAGVEGAEDSDSEGEVEELRAGAASRPGAGAGASGRTASPMHEKVPCCTSGSYVAPIEEDIMWIVEYNPVEAGFRCPTPFMIYVEHTNADGDELFRKVYTKESSIRRHQIDLGRLHGSAKGHLYAFNTSASTTMISIYLGLQPRRTGKDVQWADAPCHVFKLQHIEGEACLTGQVLSLQTNSQSIPPAGLDEGVQVDQQRTEDGSPSSPGKRKRPTEDEVNVSGLLRNPPDVEPMRASLERTVIQLSSTTDGSDFLQVLEGKEQMAKWKIKQNEEAEETGFLPRRTAAQLAQLADNKAELGKRIAKSGVAELQHDDDDCEEDRPRIIKPEVEEQRRRAAQASSGKSILEKCLKDEADKYQRLRKIWARQDEIPDARAEEVEEAIRRHDLSMQTKIKKHQAHLVRINETFQKEQQDLALEQAKLRDEWEQAKLDVKATRERFDLPDVTPIVDLLADDSGDEQGNGVEMGMSSTCAL